MNILQSQQIKKLIFSFIVIAFFVIGLQACTDKSTNKNTITKQEIIQAQKAWGNGVVAIGKAYSQHGDYKKVAENIANTFYAYQLGPVLFKPTKTAKHQFRLTKEGAISYFVGGNKRFPEDEGFALQPWTKVKFKNAGLFIDGNYAVAMGNYFFTPAQGKPIKVEYTFGYIKDKAGKLKINLQHSSLPFSVK
jgi:hypothetical protein